MSHDHKKKQNHHHHGPDKKKSHPHGHEEGQLSEAIKNKHPSDDDEDEVTPGFDEQQVTAESPKNVGADVVSVYQRGALCEVVVNVGSDQGIVEAMDAFLRASDQSHLPFAITEVRPGSTTGYVKTSEEFVQKHSAMHVVFNPA